MEHKTIKRKGVRYVLVEEAEFYRNYPADAAGLPPLPAADKQGNRPAVEFARATIAREIISRRKALGFSQAELARRAAIRVETLNRLEKMKHTADETTMKKIEAVFRKVTLTRKTTRSSSRTRS